MVISEAEDFRKTTVFAKQNVYEVNEWFFQRNVFEKFLQRHSAQKKRVSGSSKDNARGVVPYLEN